MSVLARRTRAAAGLTAAAMLGLVVAACGQTGPLMQRDLPTDAGEPVDADGRDQDTDEDER